MSEAKTGIYINGKEQALEILKLLSPKERNRILSSINLKNPTLANELKQNSISSKDLEEYSMIDFKRVFERIKPEVIGLSLQGTSKVFQQNVLKSAPREYAEKAFKTLMLKVPDSKRETIIRAKKITVTELSQINQ